MNKNNNQIRYVLIPLIMLFFSVGKTFSQPADMPINYVEESIYTFASAVNPGYSTETYFDGLGRELQKISRGPHVRDRIEMKGYDSYGRANRDYLIFATTNNKGYNYTAANEQRNYYLNNYGSTYAYSEQVYDRTVGSNVIEQSRPGTPWRIGGGHTTKTQVTKNIAGDNIRIYSILNDTTVVFNGGFYAPGMLVKKETIDPQGDKVYEYYDIEKKLIAEEVKSGTNSIYTYYLYDDLGLLRYVLPPTVYEMFNSATSKNLHELKKYCFYTEFDARRHPYKSYVPGGGCTINLYDKKDRLVLFQTETMRSQGKWLFTKYDGLDRPVISGICTGTEAQHKAGLEAQTVFGEVRESFAHGYSNQSYPTVVNGNDYQTVTYYDDYDWQGESAETLSVSAMPDPEFPHTINQEVFGLVTGTKHKILGISENKWLLSANYYDAKYREIQTVRQLYPAGIENIYRAYDFVGKLTRVREKQTVGTKMEGFDRYLTYDTPGRLSEVKQKMLGYVSTELVSIVKYKYNDLWQVAEKYVHNGIDTTKYLYAIDGSQIGSTSPLFSYKLYFDQKPDNMVYAYTPRYDGNVGFVEWNNANLTRGYKYKYDEVKQLEAADYMRGSGSQWTYDPMCGERDITYDLNGNIETLTRTDYNGDDMHYIDNTYNGNQLSEANINGTAYNYTYDANGNMTYDGYKGVHISYNLLNLPEKIFAGEAEVSYVYSASGVKLATKAGNSFTYYRGSFIYNDSELDHIIQPEGMIRKATGGYVYYYTRKDHLGSTRVLCHEVNGKMKADQNTDYYAFGLSIRSNDTNLNRYLYNGKELQDQVVNGKELMLYDFGARNYDPMLGRWFNIDPALQFTNPYIYCANNPVRYIDPDGKRINILMHNDGRPKHYDWEKGTNIWGFYSSEIQKDGTITKVPYEFGSDAFVDLATIALSQLMKGKAGYDLISDLANSSNSVSIMRSDRSVTDSKNRIGWNPSGLKDNGTTEAVPTKDGLSLDFGMNLGHELAHAQFNLSGQKRKTWFSMITVDRNGNPEKRYIYTSDIYATHIENMLRSENNVLLRTHYGIDTEGNGYGPAIIEPESGSSRYFNSEGFTDFRPLKRGSIGFIY